MLSYEGIFFEGEMKEIISSLEPKKLDIVNDEYHCTFKYHPTEEEIFNDIVGKSFEILVIGYANDGQNSGFLLSLPDELKKYYINYEEENPSVLKVPHMTLSLSLGAKASNTNKLDFKLLQNPFKIVGKFGYWIKEENKEYISYEPYYKNMTK